ncbi:hypothetical protein [Desulfovibrio inopinatus]|uniref:hypothetical protein n=1 Tax=Desulfovibrio inopinatus TaxID=102109 RepID=UPI00042634F8|nr:hypothetical protein [Desulfovibrio inopinatus]
MKCIFRFLQAIVLLVLITTGAAAASQQELGETEASITRGPTTTSSMDMSVAVTNADALSAEIAKAEAELNEKMRPFAGVYGAGFRDQNDITVLHGGIYGGGTLWDALKLRLQAMTGQIHQDAKGSRHETEVWRTAVSLGFVDLFVTPRFVLWGALGYENFQLQSSEGAIWRDSNGDLNSWLRTPMYRGYVVGGKLGLKYIFDNESEIGAEAKRESMWAEHDKYDTRLFNRITDMTKMAPDLAVNKARIFTNIVTFPEHQLHLEGGLDSMEDGNLRQWGYAHYQVPILWSRDKHWTVIRPNVYMESNTEDKPGYFSPYYHITTGVMFHTIQDFGFLEVEAEVNPQLLWTRDSTKDGDTQEGIHGLLNIAYKYESLRIGVGVFAYTDTDGYWLNRGNFFLKYSF